MRNSRKSRLNFYSQFCLLIWNWFMVLLNGWTSFICHQYNNLFYSFTVRSGSIIQVMNCKETENIIKASIFIEVLKIVDSFSRLKFGSPFSFINSRPNMKEKLIFSFTTLGIGIYFWIFIYHICFCWQSNRDNLVIDKVML